MEAFEKLFEICFVLIGKNFTREFPGNSKLAPLQFGDRFCRLFALPEMFTTASFALIIVAHSNMDSFGQQVPRDL